MAKNKVAPFFPDTVYISLGLGPTVKDRAKLGKRLASFHV